MSLSFAIRQAFALAFDANEAEAVQAIGQLKSDHQVALNRAETPGPTKFVTKADYELALNRAKSAETLVQEVQKQEIETEKNDYYNQALESLKQERNRHRQQGLTYQGHQVEATEVDQGNIVAIFTGYSEGIRADNAQPTGRSPPTNTSP